MPQVIRCPHCQKSMQVPDNVAGKQVRCPSCKQPFLVAATPVRQPAVAAVGAGAPAKAAAPAVPASAADHRYQTAAPAAPAAPVAAPGTPHECPACHSTLLSGAIACMDCGFLIQPEGAAAEPEGPPNLCTNPACGVA